MLKYNKKVNFIFLFVIILFIVLTICRSMACFTGIFKEMNVDKSLNSVSIKSEESLLIKDVSLTIETPPYAKLSSSIMQTNGDNILNMKTVKFAGNIFLPFQNITREILSIIIIFIFSILMLVTGLYIHSLSLRKKFEKLYFKDNVTGYRNWRKFKIDSEKLVLKSENEKLAMISFDINKFKLVNDIYGHSKGNEILKLIADYLSQNVMKFEVFARVASDNFNLLIIYDEVEEIYGRIRSIYNYIKKIISNYNIEASFGIYLIDDKTLSVDAMSDRASLAKSTVKGRLDRNYELFNKHLRDELIEEKELENEMEDALLRNEFEVFLQPKINFKTGKIVGAEALVRWRHSSKGIIFPGKFIPLFEKNGFIKKLDIYMFREVCKLLSKWKKNKNSFNDLVISVNFSRINLSNGTIIETLEQIIKEQDIPPYLLEVEITESVIFESIELFMKIMKELKQIGVMISIDDFGSGYSSLSTLKNIPADIIKLDKTLLDEATDSAKGREIIRCLIDMNKVLGLQTVAEGVEKDEQYAFLKEIECDIGQGYFFAKPMIVSDFETMFAKLNNL